MAHGLAGTEFRVVAVATRPEEALRLAADARPDVALVAAALGNGTGMHVTDRLPKEHRVPVVLLVRGGLVPLSVNLATQTGVMGCIVEPVLPAALCGALQVAVYRFQEFCALQQESAALRQNIEDRKIIERAKGLLMEAVRLSEREAYARIRRKSMDTQRPMADIARAMILSTEMSLNAP
jgi:response regulator NasT